MVKDTQNFGVIYHSNIAAVGDVDAAAADLSASAARQLEALAAAQRQINDLQRQLVAYDALLEGNVELAHQVAPGAFEIVRRRHVTQRLPRAVLELAFPWRGGDEDQYQRWLWDNVRQRRHYVSCGLTRAGRFDLARGAAMPDPVTGRPLLHGETSLPKSGYGGLPKDCCWLLASWNLEVRAHPDEWDCRGIDGSVGFNYNRGQQYERPLSDALRGLDLDTVLVMRENLAFEIVLDCRRCAEPLVERPVTVPRLYVNLDVVEKKNVY